MAHAFGHVAEVRTQHNPACDVLGVVVGKYRRQATRRMAGGRSELENLLRSMDAPVRIYEPWIRDTEAAKKRCG